MSNLAELREAIIKAKHVWLIATPFESLRNSQLQVQVSKTKMLTALRLPDDLVDSIRFRMQASGDLIIGIK